MADDTGQTDTDAETIEARWQYCKDGYDIGGNLYAEDDADTIRAWEGEAGDFCLIEVTRTQRGRWTLTGGDGSWTKAAKRTYATPADALTAVVGTWVEVGT